MTEENRPTTTTDSGIPVSSDEFSLTVGPQGPTVLHDHYVVQKMQHFNRERVPERVVHAKGSGAHGFFEVTNDISQYTKASLFAEVGKRTPMFARFSTVAGEQGYPDTVRDPRGFALKFYTDQGNYDLVGNNTPVFFVRDSSKFQDFIHSQKRLPDTGMRSNDMQWDFWTLSPESAHQVTILMSDRGTPRTYRHMNGYGSHTFSWMNAGGEKFWIKYHFKTVQGPETFTDAEATQMAAEDPDYPSSRPPRGDRRGQRPGVAAGGPDHALRRGGGLSLQPLRSDQGVAAHRLPRDRGWSHGAGPQPGELLRRGGAGRLLARQPGAGNRPQPRQDADGPDLLLPRHPSAPHRRQLRAAADQRAPGASALLQQGRAMAYRHSGDQPVYAPNSYGGPKADPKGAADIGWSVEAAEVGRYANAHHREDDDFGQAGTLYREVMSDTDRDHLVENVVGHASNEVTRPIQERVVAYWSSVDSELGRRVAGGLGIGNGGGPAGDGHAAERRRRRAGDRRRARQPCLSHRPAPLTPRAPRAPLRRSAPPRYG